MEPALEREQRKWSEICPICKGRAKKVDAPAFMFLGVLPSDKTIFCPKHGWIVVRTASG